MKWGSMEAAINHFITAFLDWGIMLRCKGGKPDKPPYTRYVLVCDHYDGAKARSLKQNDPQKQHAHINNSNLKLFSAQTTMDTTAKSNSLDLPFGTCSAVNNEFKTAPSSIGSLNEDTESYVVLFNWLDEVYHKRLGCIIKDAHKSVTAAM
ncbi:UNVERIFIED_CONTAM: hypothetical protein HDU68_006782, partial [Siphonaria sp. JEL0065]